MEFCRDKLKCILFMGPITNNKIILILRNYGQLHFLELAIIHNDVLYNLKMTKLY